MSWLRRLFNALRPARVQRDIDREIDFHLREREDELRAGGLSDQDARRRARVQFGNALVQRERTQDVDIALWLDTSLRNVRHAVRALIHVPGFSLTVIVTLALGIGANGAVFSAMDAVLLQPLPFREPDRLASLTQSSEGAGESTSGAARILDWSRLSTTFQSLTGHVMEDVSDHRRSAGARKTSDGPASFSRRLGRRPAARARVHRRGAPPWRTGGDPDQRTILALALRGRSTGAGKERVDG
jgi:hypothetical protein